MRFSKLLIPTLKEPPAEAQVASHVYLIRGGYIRKLAAGVYTLLPLGVRVVQKIERIVRQELDATGAQEVLLPMFHPKELWVESGRWQAYGPELLRIRDRKDTEFAVSPTAEEAIVDLVRRDVRSYRQLPLTLYQIQDKFRDEMRPRAGLMRGREFIMKDAYSFHADDADAAREYKVMYDAYSRIFRRCGLEFRAVEADTGAIGGNQSHEFQVLAESGEDAIVACDKCDYAANIEKAELAAEAPPAPVEATGRLEELHTPGKGGIEDVAKYLKEPIERFVKTLVYRAVWGEQNNAKPPGVTGDFERTVIALVRGDRQLNEIKLKAALKADHIELAGDDLVEKLTGARVGYAGPQGLKADVYADPEVAAIANAITGANKTDYHVRGFNLSREVPNAKIVDLRTAAQGDRCARCEEGHYRAFRGIEVGHVFFLGKKYSEPMRCTFLDDAGKEQVMTMGCYGIGITRIAAAAIEQNHDADGIIWPQPIAPFEVEIVAAGREPEVMRVADELEAQLTAARIEVLCDDRDERPGVKFKDADLIGIPLRVTVGKKGLAEGAVEVKRRRSSDVMKVPVAAAAAHIAHIVEEMRDRYGLR
jgi:prolyl-tRNA synthetase